MSDHSGGFAGHHAGGFAGHHGGHHGPAQDAVTAAPPVPLWPCVIDDPSRSRPVPAYAGWGSRAGAHLLDAVAGGGAVVVAAFAAGIIGLLARNAAAGGAVAVVLVVAAVSWLFYNRYVRAGRTGQSAGKSALRIRLVDAQTGRPIGTGRALARDLAHVIDGLLCCGGYLMPLWDARRQTIADKVAGTVVVRDAEASSGPAQFAPAPLSQGGPPASGPWGRRWSARLRAFFSWRGWGWLLPLIVGLLGLAIVAMVFLLAVIAYVAYIMFMQIFFQP